jgi:hypothetical protein
MHFPLAKFDEFSKHLIIDSKEESLRPLYPLLGTQRRFVSEIARGIERGIHWFVILKARQIGISTISQALDLFWPNQFPGLNGGLVVHDGAARDQFRSQFEMFRQYLPRDWRPPITQHNPNQMVFKNGSRLFYAVAGTKKRGGALGKAKALAFLHATEVSAWGDPEGIASLKATLAEDNPHRLYIWESTAQGFNHYHDMWLEAKQATTQSAVFIAWWHNERYRKSRESDEFRVYWGKTGKPNHYERTAMRDVAALYGDTIDEEQWAWYRWQLKEKQGDELLMQQNYPTTEMEAFITTGTTFFNGAMLTEFMKGLKSAEAPPAKTYRVEVRGEFKDTELVVVNSRFATLWVWEEARADGAYIVAADPAYGSSDWGDRFVVSVWRAYADRLIQVAEFVDHQTDTYAFAWIIAYLAGYYSPGPIPCHVILEINGPGQAVLNELNNLKRMRFMAPSDPARAGIANVMRGISQYVYRRPDSFGGTGMLQWQSTYQTKRRAMYTLRDYLSRRMMEVRSEGLVEEMKGIEEEAGSAPEGTGRSKDDRVTAASLAAVCWDSAVRARLIQRGVSYRAEGERQSTIPPSGAQRALTNYLQAIGLPKSGYGKR